jgi:hypothetical protein
MDADDHGNHHRPPIEREPPMYPEQALRMVNDIHELRRREAATERLAQHVLPTGTAIPRVSIGSIRPPMPRRTPLSR